MIHVVTIPYSIGKSNHKYFNPRFTVIDVGETIKWINTDSKTHNLIFDKEVYPYKAEIGLIKPKESISREFNEYVPQIDYRCALHPEEQGTIVLYPTQETKTISKKKISKLNSKGKKNISPTKKHLNNYKLLHSNEIIFKDTIVDHVTLKRFLDPYIYSRLKNPYTYQLQSMNLTIVFWDIHGFSTLCNRLILEPVTIVGFLREYFDIATKIIHKNHGISDKFIGDGILAYFGNFDKNLTHDHSGVFSAIKSALELRKSFEKIKKKWIGIWKRDFDHDNIHIDLKCGIHTGDVLFGLLDTDTRSQVTIIGPNVNLASRLEGLANNSQIIISKDVKKIIENKYKIKPIPIFSKNRIKSFPNIKEVYEVVEKIK